MDSPMAALVGGLPSPNGMDFSSQPGLNSTAPSTTPTLTLSNTTAASTTGMADLPPSLQLSTSLPSPSILPTQPPLASSLSLGEVPLPSNHSAPSTPSSATTAVRVSTPSSQSSASVPVPVVDANNMSNKPFLVEEPGATGGDSIRDGFYPLPRAGPFDSSPPMSPPQTGSPGAMSPSTDGVTISTLPLGPIHIDICCC
jgi:hypothetical protein